MAPTVPVGELPTARAGDTWIWDQAFPTYPADEGWTVSYHFRGAQTLDTQSTEIVAEGSGWRITIPAGRTEGLAPGAYAWTARVTGSGSYLGQIRTAKTGVLTVERNLVAAGDGEVESNQDERDLAVIRARISGRLSDDLQSYQIAGRAVTAIPMLELYAIASRLERKIRLAKTGKPFTEHFVRLA